MINIDEKTGSKKLAETLKRAGIASSVHDAHRMADDITNTERKVQKHFDEKKEVLREEMINRVHGKKKEEKSQEKEINHVRPKVEVTIEEQQDENEVIGTHMPSEETAVEVKSEVLQSNKPLKELLNEEPAVEKEEVDYINKHIIEEKEGIPVQQSAQQPIEELEEPAVEQSTKDTGVEPVMHMEKEELISAPEQKIEESEQEERDDYMPKIDADEYFNYAKKDMKPSERIADQQQKQDDRNIEEEKMASEPQKTIESSVPVGEPHPKTGDEQEVDLLDYFNFSKR